MPVIQKQVTIPAQQTALPGSLLSRVRKVTDIQAGIRISLYGNPKTGKTRLACTFPKPALIIGAEDGTASVVGMDGVDFILLERCEELREITDNMLRDGKYKTAIIDSGTSLRDMRIKEILRLSEMPVQKGFGFASRDQWGECSMSLKQLLRPLFDVAKRGILENLVFIAQEQAYNGGEEGASSDLIKPTVTSALGESLAKWVNAECDCIGQTFVRMQIITKTHQPIKDGPTVTMKEKTGEQEFCLRLGTDGVYQAGIRVRQGLVLQQSILTNPSYDRLLRVIKGETVE